MTKDEQPQSVMEAAIDEAVSLYVGRCRRNLGRVRALIHAANLVAAVDHAAHTDILRSAVVFLHASLEELLRQVAVNFLPHADESVLNNVPLVGTPGRAEKFFLGRLSRHRGKSVDELIVESVRHHLETSNFNDVDEIVRLLQSLQIKTDGCQSTFPSIKELMERRHQIVHRADGFDEKGVTKLRPLEPEIVMRWLDAVDKFLDAIYRPVVIGHLLKNGTMERGADGNYRLLK